MHTIHAKRSHFNDDDSGQTPPKVRLVASSVTEQQQERIRVLEREVQELNEEVTTLINSENKSLEHAEAERARLYKSDLTHRAEIVRLEDQNRALKQEIFSLKYVKRKCKEAVVQTEAPRSPSLGPAVNERPAELLQGAATQATFLQLKIVDASSDLQTSDQGNVGATFEQGQDSSSSTAPLATRSTITSSSVETALLRKYDNKVTIGGGPSISSVDPHTSVVVNTLHYPADAAVNQQAMAWFPDAFAYLNVDLGPEFTSLVSSWISLERTSQWRTNPKIRLPTLNRPTLLADWVDKKRYKVKANEPDVMKHCGDDFAVGVKTWWASLQPAWRQGSVGDRLSKPSPDGWKSVDKYGLNGWFGILVCLKWWGWNLQHRSKEDKAQGIRDWLDTVEDVRYLMDALTDNRRDHVVSQSA